MKNLRRVFVSIGFTVLGLYTQAAIGSAENQAQTNNQALDIQSCRSNDGQDCALSWNSCTKLAETNRNERNMLFMLRAKRLINKNIGFLGHSESTQELFCAEIRRCEASHTGQYSNNEYPSCND
ncbi:hypothetical protein OAO10_02455 [Luminiphilus sp.]|nr:hypothetical protein [Luminiphilus sp.]